MTIENWKEEVKKVINEILLDIDKNWGPVNVGMLRYSTSLKGHLREKIESLLAAQTTEFANLLRGNKDWIWGTICKKCGGTGMDDQVECLQCRGTGIDNWKVEEFIDKFLSHSL